MKEVSMRGMDMDRQLPTPLSRFW